MKLSSQITFLYFQSLEDPAEFFEKILDLTLIDDQGFAKIYRISRGAFIGIVDEAQGHCGRPTEQNVLVTLVTDDVDGWYQRLKNAGIAVEEAPKIHEPAKVHGFFFEGPGGYAFEIQRFLDPVISAEFE